MASIDLKEPAPRPRHRALAWAIAIGGWFTLASIGHGILFVEEVVNDWWLTPKLLYLWGPDLAEAAALRARAFVEIGASVEQIRAAGYWASVVLLVFYAILINLLLVWGYNRSKIDWLGLEEPKRYLAKGAARGPFSRAMLWLANWLLYLFFVFIWTDPILATLQVRAASQGYAMKKGNWATFWFAVLFATGAWIAQVTGFMEWIGIPYVTPYWDRLLAWLSEHAPWLHWLLA